MKTFGFGCLLVTGALGCFISALGVLSYIQHDSSYYRFRDSIAEGSTANSLMDVRGALWVLAFLISAAMLGLSGSSLYWEKGEKP